MNALLQTGILLAVALVWLLVNIKAGDRWLQIISIVGLLAFMVLASWVAFLASIAS